MSDTITITCERIPAHNDRLIVRIGGDLDAGNADYAIHELELAYDDGVKVCIMDFTDLHFMDSTGSLCVFNFHLFLSKHGVSLIIFGLGANVATTFQALGIAQLIKMYRTYEEVLANLPPAIENK